WGSRRATAGWGAARGRRARGEARLAPDGVNVPRSGVRWRTCPWAEVSPTGPARAPARGGVARLAGGCRPTWSVERPRAREKARPHRPRAPRAGRAAARRGVLPRTRLRRTLSARPWQPERPRKGVGRAPLTRGGGV